MVKPQAPQDVIDSWPKPNFTHPHTRSHPIFVGVTLAFTTTTLIVVGLRTYVRFFILKKPGWDDYFIFVASLGAIGMCIAVNLAMNYGWDRHYWDQRPEWFEVSELMQWIIQIIFIILMSSAKLSALCTYLRAAQGTKYRRFVWGTMVIVALWGISFFFATVFECTPVQLYWTGKDGKGCSNEDARLLVATIINIITDIQVVLMPIPIIIRLHIRLREKLTLLFLMGLGAIATVASIVRTVVMSESLTGLRYDMTWNAFIVWIWLVVECNLAIICISVPVCRVLVKRFFEKRGNAPETALPPAILSPGIPKPQANSSMASLPQENRSFRIATPLGAVPHNGGFASNAGELQSPIIGYDRYGQPILREEPEEEVERQHQTIAQAV